MGRKAPRVDTRVASVVTLQPLLAYARTRGVDVPALLRSIGVDPRGPVDFDHWVPERVRIAAWERAAVEAADPAFGIHVAAQASVGSYDVLDYALASSATLGDAYGRIVRFGRVLADGIAMNIEIRDALAHVRRVCVTPRQEAEAVAAVLVRRARELTGRDIVPREIRFAHPAPEDREPLDATFRCTLRFDMPANEIVLRASELAYPLVGANRGLVKVLDRYMTEILARLPANSTLEERARKAVAQEMSNGRPSLAATARLLHASPRTLQRELHEAGTTHRELVERVRREVAARLVDTTQLSLTEIAFLLGFSDVSGFRRTFKRWTGSSPAHARSRAA